MLATACGKPSQQALPEVHRGRQVSGRTQHTGMYRQPNRTIIDALTVFTDGSQGAWVSGTQLSADDSGMCDIHQ